MGGLGFFLSFSSAEVLRTRLREAPAQGDKRRYTGLVQSTRLIFAEEGLRGFYKGLLPHIIRVVPNSALIFLTYEFVIHVCSHVHLVCSRMLIFGLVGGTVEKDNDVGAAKCNGRIGKQRLLKL